MQEIQNFTTNLIALWRPKKRTYYALTWDAGPRHWKPWYGVVEGGLSKHKSTAHIIPGRVNIKLMNRNALIRLHCTGEFLMLGTTRITIAKRVTGISVPQSWMAHELGPLIQRTGVDEMISLWDHAPPVPVAPAPSPIVTLINARALKYIPKRIAWLVAEDAAKNEEKCPITMEAISPITASVTSCYHTFDTTAIQAWLTTHTTCPQCRTPCVATQCFEDN